nr:coatomer subunit beta-like [Parasteatoda tepidariorum]
MFELMVSQAMGVLKKDSATDLSSSKLSKVTQLTGFSDPVYAEGYVHVNQYDIVLDVLIVNQTSDTLQNCTLELATLVLQQNARCLQGVARTSFVSFCPFLLSPIIDTNY